MKRGIAVTFVAAVFALSGVASVLAGNWGAGSWGGSSDRCVVNSFDSECTADGNSHYVWIHSLVPDEFREALTASVNSDYTGITDYSMTIDTVYRDGNDVRVYPADNRGIPYFVYTSCPSYAIFSGGNGYYRACHPQIMPFDEDKPSWTSCKTSSTCLAWYACHELGHTTGLQHPGTSPNVTAVRDTCMDYDNHNAASRNPHPHDEEHLTECYPKPNASPQYYYLTGLCEDYQ